MFRRNFSDSKSGFPNRWLVLLSLLILGMALVSVSGVPSSVHASQAVPRYYDSLPPAGGGAAPYVTAATWAKTTLTYKIINCPSSLDCGEAQNAVRQAAAAWDAASGLTAC